MKRCLEIALLVVFFVLLPIVGCKPASEGKIAFVSDFEEPGQRYFVYLMDPDGSNQIKLGEYHTGLQWSPDGQRIAFLDFEHNEICIAGADGKNLSTVKPAITDEYETWSLSPSFSWSPDGANIAMTIIYWEEPVWEDIHVINLESGAARKLTDSPGTRKLWVAWSPGGRQIAFVLIDRVSWDDSTRDHYSIYLVDADGSNQRMLASGPNPTGQISWSPDGKKLMYVSSDEIWLVDVEDGTTVNLTNTPDIRDGDPAWSPDGKRIAFTSGPPLGVTQIHIMDADGSNVVKLTRGPVYCSRPSWSPDGKKIVFSAGPVSRPGGGEQGWSSLFIVDIDSRKVIDLIPTGPGHYESPVWSPH